MKIYNISEIPEGLRAPSYEEVLLSGYTDGYDKAYEWYSELCKPYDQRYLTAEALEDGVFRFSAWHAEYSVNGGAWYDATVADQFIEVPMNTGDTIRFRLNKTNDYDYINIGEFYGYTSVKFKLYGNIESLEYGSDFIGKDTQKYRFMGFSSDGLVDAENLVLPAMNLIPSAYTALFLAKNMEKGPKVLPATALTEGCYSLMFRGCKKLTTVPVLPATTMARNCYSRMFEDCYALQISPELPATTLAPYCYYGMFTMCMALANAPALPATTLAEGCYEDMFNSCTNALTTAPELPATNLAENCYLRMFSNCWSLDTPPSELPATILTPGCYEGMFSETYISSAPELKAPVLVDRCYKGMFSGCLALTYVKCMATSITATECTKGWLSFWYETHGTFVHPCGVEWVKDSEDGIPSGWTVIDGCPTDYASMFLELDIISGGTIMFSKQGQAGAPDVVLDYTLDSGATWTTFTSSTEPYVINVQAGDKVMFRGDNEKLNLPAASGAYGSSRVNCFSGSTAYFNACGNVCSLLKKDGFKDVTVTPDGSGGWSWLFRETNVCDASNLILPAALDYTCFNRLFEGCTHLTTSPVIPEQANTGISQYFHMFYECSSLTRITALMTNISGFKTTEDWVYGVPAEGIFIKNSSMTGWTTGVNGIPSGWTVVDAT